MSSPMKMSSPGKPLNKQTSSAEMMDFTEATTDSKENILDTGNLIKPPRLIMNSPNKSFGSPHKVPSSPGKVLTSPVKIMSTPPKNILISPSSVKNTQNYITNSPSKIRDRTVSGFDTPKDKVNTPGKGLSTPNNLWSTPSQLNTPAATSGILNSPAVLNSPGVPQLKLGSAFRTPMTYSPRLVGNIHVPSPSRVDLWRAEHGLDGFMQPTIAIAMLNMDDFDGFNDRHVAIVCPERNKVYFEDLVPLPAASPSIANILSLLRRQHHEENRTYELDAEAKEAFSTFYNELEDRMEKHSDNEDHRGVLSKAQGQTARLALVLRTLHSAVQHRDRPYEEFVTELTIRKDVIVWAINLMEFCIQQKFALMPPPVLETCETPEYDFNKVWETHPRKVKSLLEYDRQDFEPSFVAQRRLLPPQKQSQTSNNKYPTAAAKAYLSTIAEAGLGDMVEPSQSGSRKRSKTMVFRKRKFDDLEGDAKDILNSLDISKDAFDGKIRKTTDEQD